MEPALVIYRTMKVQIRPPESKNKKDEIEMDVNPDEMLESLKKKIEKKCGFEVHMLQINGKNLHDEKTLRGYDVQEGTTLFVMSQYHNQYLPMGVQPQMDKRKADEAELNKHELAPEAKRAAAAAAALNITEAEVAWCGLRAATYGEKGMRRQMEDEHLICPSLQELVPGLPNERNFAFFAIFDGHGGKQVAEFVKTYLAVELANAMAHDEPREGPLSDKRLKKITEAVFQRMDSRIASELSGVYDGCTACVVLANSEQMFCANLGDSMAYLCRMKDGSEEDLHSIPLQMRQHKCWMMKEKERILRAGGAVENGRINGILEVSRAFGDITLKKFGVLCSPEYMKFSVDRTKDRFVIIACDGFWNVWTAAEAVEYAHSLVANEEGRARLEGDSIDLKGVCKDLVTNVIEEKKAQDNVSVLLLHFMPEG